MFHRILLYIFILGPVIGSTQHCDLTLQGRITDSGTGEPLEFVNILILETQQGTSTDSTGSFRLMDICPEDIHVTLSHIGCESKQVFIQIRKDTSVAFVMDHSDHVLHGVEITGTESGNTTQEYEIITEQEITDNASENLSNLLENISGVSTIKNGSGIAKPVVQGLYGNRLTILNNGVAQSGQQWGNDHSPEIDPLVANKIKVIKGTSALQYMGVNLGSIVLVEPKRIEQEPHLHGRINYTYETNGRGHGLHVQLGQFNSSLGWKVNGTIKKSGDKKSPNYFLNNTGIEEANFAIQLEKIFTEKHHIELYYSTFNTRLGILRGSHIGNLTDLESAIVREVPFFTEEDFSYQIDAPRQQVHHHLLKLHSKYFLDQSQWFDLTFATQLNIRKEFDVRRSGRSDIPALDIKQYSYFLEAKYNKEYQNNFKLHTGLQFNLTDNTNQPETGILPLIPDYFNYESGMFLLLTKTQNKSLFELGLRYDNNTQKVVTISQTTPREIIRFNNTYHNISTSAGWNYNVTDELGFSVNSGYAVRNPATNELYSGGLHQGVSGIEEGNINLQSEKSWKTTLGANIGIHHIFHLESLLYYQSINDYIFLNPQNEFRLTIRGAFPVFAYAQTDARIFGFDLNGDIEISESLHTQIKYSYIKGDDVENDLPLINIPTNNFLGSLTYAFLKPITLGRLQLENAEIEINNKYVFRQNHLLETQDFALPPEAYNLFGFSFSTDIQVKKTRWRIVAKVDNLFNIKYRDYLNRQRYFADDLGLNASFGVNLKF